MKRFSVWIRPLAGDCRVRVEGMQNARWLLDRLSQSFVFKSCEPIDEDLRSASANFRVLYGSQVSRSSLEKLLAAIPQVNLMLEPARD